MTGWIRSVSFSLALATSACTSLPYKTPVIEAMAPTTGAFQGLRSIVPGKPLKVLVVHGMCSHDFNWVLKWTGAMGRAFGSAAVSRPSDPVGAIQTARFDFNDNGRTVEVTFALWSPATDLPKQSLAYDSGSSFPYKRAKFNDIAKSMLINDCFADPVIYSGSLAPGSVGEGIRRDMAGVVCRFMGGQWQPGTCQGGDSAPDRAFITESLGSKILFDAVNHLATRDIGAVTPLRDALGKTRAIYMLANQLPLLRLAEARTGVATSRVMESELRWFGPAAAPEERSAVAAVAPSLQVVAFTDPNDQFSYRLTYASLGEDPKRLALFNVIVSNDKTYFGLVENPYPAHIGYWDNPRVPPMVLEGGEGTR
jgi:hypothetical protein